MNRKSAAPSGAIYLGIECGGTRSIAIVTDHNLELLERREFGPGNFRLLSPEQLLAHLRKIAAAFPAPVAVGIGMAGVRGEPDIKKVSNACSKIWPGLPIAVSHDLETALAAAGDPVPGGPVARVIVLSGTGSCTYGRSTTGKTAKVGGWGHILGDKGSGFEIGLRALKAVIYYLDRDGEWSLLGRRILRNLHLNSPEDLIAWVQSAAKSEVAALAIEVFGAADQGDRIARDILEGAADSLARDAVNCAARLAKKGKRVEFFLTGSVLLRQPAFARKVGGLIRKGWRNASVKPLEREGAFGAAVRARAVARGATAPKETPARKRAAEETVVPELSSILQSPTEQRNPRSMRLDRMSTVAAVEMVLSEDAKIPPALLREKAKIARAIELIARAFKRGGRLIYAGAGTSGRLGVLDASECPPTFGTPHEQVQGIMAGGQRAIWESIEGAEDEVETGADSIRFRGVTSKDVVVGIAASGRTPFVWGALAEARKRGAATVLVCLNPHLQIPAKHKPTVVIAPDIGPEILTGSTRLKSGTATKLILNMFTTLAMARTGKVISNLMVDVSASNTKLKDRATRILCALSKWPYDKARTALEKNNWSIKAVYKTIRSSRK